MSRSDSANLSLENLRKIKAGKREFYVYEHPIIDESSKYLITEGANEAVRAAAEIGAFLTKPQFVAIAGQRVAIHDLQYTEEHEYEGEHYPDSVFFANTVSGRGQNYGLDHLLLSLADGFLSDEVSPVIIADPSYNIQSLGENPFTAMPHFSGDQNPFPEVDTLINRPYMGDLNYPELDRFIGMYFGDELSKPFFTKLFIGDKETGGTMMMDHRPVLGEQFDFFDTKYEIVGIENKGFDRTTHGYPVRDNEHFKKDESNSFGQELYLQVLVVDSKPIQSIRKQQANYDKKNRAFWSDLAYENGLSTTEIEPGYGARGAKAASPWYKMKDPISGAEFSSGSRYRVDSVGVNLQVSISGDELKERLGADFKANHVHYKDSMDSFGCHPHRYEDTRKYITTIVQMAREANELEFTKQLIDFAKQGDYQIVRK